MDTMVSVAEWWGEHPLNPANRDAGNIISPIHEVSLNPGDSLQDAIDSLPATGGTLRLAAGRYEGGFEILTRKHVHLIGEGETVIYGGENFVIGSKLNHEYGDFCEAVDRGEADVVKTVHTLPTQDIYFKNIDFDTSPVRLGSCRGILFDECVFQQEENRNVGDRDEKGNKVLRWYRPLPVTGIMGLRSIWFRGCEFRGHHANAYYLDGAQASGAVNCIFASKDALWHNAILLFTNDDLSVDVTGDEKLDSWERRDIRYYVVDGCTFGGKYARGAVAASGRDILLQNNKVEGPLESFAVLNAKTSGKPVYYEAFGIIVRNNDLPKVNAIVTAEGAADRPESGIPDWWVWTKYQIGRFTITENRISKNAEVLRELPRDSEILGPHVIAGNGVK